MRQDGFFRDRLPALIIRAMMAAMLMIPMPVGCLFGRAWGFVAYYLLGDMRRRTLGQIGFAFRGEMGRRAQARLAHRMSIHFGQALVEVIYAGKLLQPRTVRRYVHVHNEHYMHEAAAGGRGVIYATAHLGHWEVLGQAMGLLGHPLHSLYRPLPRPRLDALGCVIRERHGQRLVPAEGGIRRLAQILREGGYVGMLADQYARRGGVYVDFFGLPSRTPGILGLLALRTGAPVVLGYAVRRGRGCFCYDLFVEPPLEVKRTGDARRDVAAFTQAYMNSVEKFARRFPEQYLWIHKRWRPKDLRPAAGDAPTNKG